VPKIRPSINLFFTLASFGTVDLDFIFFSVNSKKLEKSWKICQLPFKAKNLGEKKNHPSLLMEQIFFSIFCDAATLVIDPPQEELAKFGYRSKEHSIVESF